MVITPPIRNMVDVKACDGRQSLKTIYQSCTSCVPTILMNEEENFGTESEIERAFSYNPSPYTFAKVTDI